MKLKQKMSKRKSLKPLFGVLAGAALAATSAQATIIDVTGPTSSAGAAAQILNTLPVGVLNGNVTNTAQWGFNEAQGVTTSIVHNTDGGSIDVGTKVDSHMIFLNRQGKGRITHRNVVWTFSGIILGVMSDRAGTYEVASTPELGATGTNYPGASFRARGLEANDSYSILGGGNMLSVNMRVTQPGDWIRVVTASSVPEPATFGLLAMGLGLLGLRRKSRA